jgi:hypothetical protein
MLATTQPVLRLRSGTRLTSEEGRISAIVTATQFQRGKTVLLVRVTRGMRAAAALPLGGSHDWFDTGAFWGRTAGRSAVTRLAGIPPAAALSPLAVPPDLLTYARSLRQP